MVRLAIILLLAIGLPVHADPLVIIVNSASGVERMTRAEVADVYMARAGRLASGKIALPLDVQGNGPKRERFYAALVGRSMAEVDAYWARLLFTGRATPPQRLRGDQAILDAVAQNPGAIGFIEKSKVDARVRVVLELSQ